MKPTLLLWNFSLWPEEVAKPGYPQTVCQQLRLCKLTKGNKWCIGLKIIQEAMGCWEQLGKNRGRQISLVQTLESLYNPEGKMSMGCVNFQIVHLSGFLVVPQLVSSVSWWKQDSSLLCWNNFFLKKALMDFCSVYFCCNRWTWLPRWSNCFK